MLEKAREIMEELYISNRYSKASLKASELVDELLNELEGGKNEPSRCNI